MKSREKREVGSIKKRMEGGLYKKREKKGGRGRGSTRFAGSIFSMGTERSNEK